jgi:hypothetical protein
LKKDRYSLSQPERERRRRTPYLPHRLNAGSRLNAKRRKPVGELPLSRSGEGREGKNGTLFTLDSSVRAAGIAKFRMENIIDFFSKIIDYIFGFSDPNNRKIFTFNRQ